MWIWFVSVVVGGYLIGCVHGSTLAHKLSGVNMKESGTKNAGASNVTMVLGKKFGALVAAIDIGKGVLVILLTQYSLEFSGFPEETSWFLLFLVSAAVMIGHIFPFYMKFNGGKGTATIIGILLAMDWRFGLLAFGLFIVFSIITDFLVYGVLWLYVTFIIFSVWFVPGKWLPIIALGVFWIAFLKHIENFQRIKSGEEKRISTVFGKRK